MTGPVHFTQEGKVAILEIDNPPVNAISQAVRRALLDALMRADSDASVGAIVIAGAGSTFVAGSDITEFGKRPLEPHLPDVINRIEESGKPVVMAWHGNAFGGGCEIGLAAHRRIVARDGQVGLPDVKLGLIPGAGGTQRLPRLIGLPAALDMIATGRSIGAEEALAIGLVDEIVEGNPRARAITIAGELVGQMQPRLSLRPVPPTDSGAWEAMIAKVRREARGRHAPLRAIELVSQTLNMPFTTAQPIERATFFELMGSEQSLALRHIFMAERLVQKVPGINAADARRIDHVGIIGAGTIAAGIAIAFLDAGFSVTLTETSDAALKAGMERVEGLYARAFKSGRMDEAARMARLARLKPTTELAALAPCALVIEAMAEDMAIKLELLAKLEPVIAPDTLIATNTSYLDIEAMADSLNMPERFLGLHFFSPANIMKLVEIVRARRSSPATIASAMALSRRMQKIGVVCGVCEGFIGNRILAKFRAQCEFMLEEGALPQEIDAALEAFGLALGPFALQDLAGLDIAWSRRKRQAASRNPGERDVPLLERLCEQGRFGQKSGRGWYRYVDGRRQIDPETDALVRANASASGRTQRPFSSTDIQTRIVAAMVNEGAKIIEEGIASRPLEVDVVLVNGYGFPAWRGGPMQEADARGLSSVLASARETARRDGPAFSVAPLLEKLVAARSSFASLNAPLQDG